MERRIFQLIDLDRTIFDTSRFAKALTDEINLTEPGVGTALDEQYEAAYANEETFFLLRFLREEHGDAWFEDLVTRVVEKIGAPSLVFDGVLERLAAADSVTSCRPSWGILTYGDDIDQRMKARLIGLEDAPFYVSETPDKSELIHSWKQTDGTFKLPKEFGGDIVDHVTLEDDKLRAFRGLPEGALGFWVTSDVDATGRLAEARETGVPSTVTPVRSISQTIELLKNSI